MFDLFLKQEQQDYPIFGKFCYLYGSSLTSKCSLLTKFKIRILPIDQYLTCINNFPQIDDGENQPFACFVKNNSEYAESTVAGVVFKQSLIDELDLTESEQFAAIAHEIGHILYFYLENKDSYPCEEVYADMQVCDLDLSEALYSLLKKLRDSDRYINYSDNLIKRIGIISQFIRF